MNGISDEFNNGRKGISWCEGENNAWRMFPHIQYIYHQVYRYTLRHEWENMLNSQVADCGVEIILTWNVIVNIGAELFTIVQISHRKVTSNRLYIIWQLTVTIDIWCAFTYSFTFNITTNKMSCCDQWNVLNCLGKVGVKSSNKSIHSYRDIWIGTRTLSLQAWRFGP